MEDHIRKEIAALRKKRNAVILAHYYQDEEIQDLADFVGDSLDLSRKAAATKAQTIVFCGVKFMAEVAKILSPERLVLLPDLAAGCSLEDSCPPTKFARFIKAHPNHKVISYINCSAEVKALSDVIVTSSNAKAIVESFSEDQPLIFAPDRHLGAYLNQITGRKMVLWQGSCIVHEQFSERKLVQLKVAHPDAVVTAHPECQEEILAHADHIGSTSAMLKFVTSSEAEKFIIATEKHLIHQMEKAVPQKQFIPAPIGVDETECDNCAECPYMALNTAAKLHQCLERLTPAIELSEPLRQAAQKPLLRMLELSPPQNLTNAA